MDAAILLQLSHSSSPHHQPLHYNYFGDRVADRNTLAAHSSFVRSSAPRQMPQYTSQFLSSSFRSTYPMASSSGSGSFVAGGSRVGSPYDVSDTELHTPAPQTYHAEQYPSASSSWSQQVDQSQPPQYTADPYTSASYELAESSLMHSPVKSEDAAHIEPYSGLYLPPYTDHIHGSNPLNNDQHPPLAASYNVATGHFQPTESTQAQMSYSYANHEHQHQQSGGPDVANMSPYMLGNDAPLPYADYADGDMPRFVHPAQVSPPSPFAQLQDVGPPGQSCDPRFTVNPVHGLGSSGASPSDFTDFELDSGSTSGGDSPSASLALSAPIPMPAPGARKRQRSVSFTSSSEDEYHVSSGESEQGDGDDDDEYVQSPRTRRRRQLGEEDPQARSPSTSPGSSLGGGRRLAPPVPVPNLTKKSRGRRVPTVQQVGEGGIQKRMYMCKVAGCGKCFARGEHLKRHVRSIHTNEKPHKCPYPGCGKDFSRHDNLGQHMRVHKGFQMPKGSRL
ncbi:hypothetical protein V8D89_006422 [Ganoderma adspersum]